MAGLFLGLVFGSVGLAYAVYGKRQEEYMFLIFGVLLMAGSYFMSDPVWGTLVGVLLTAGPFVVRRFL